MKRIKQLATALAVTMALGVVAPATVLAQRPATTEVTIAKDNVKEEKLSIQGSHGILSATLARPVKGEKNPKVMAVLMHGFMGKSDSPMHHYLESYLADAGIASIRFDFNGHGKSEGEFQDMTVLNEIEDAKCVIKYIQEHYGIKKVALIGHSQGGVVASMTAGQLGKKVVKSVVLLAPAAVLREDAIRGNTFSTNYDPLHAPEYVQLPNGLKLGRDYIETAFSLPIYPTAARYQGPALIIHGTGDRIAPYSYGERFNEIWRKSTLHLMPGFDHGFSQDLKGVTHEAAQFVARTLK